MPSETLASSPTTNPFTARSQLIERLAIAAASDPSNVDMPHREALILATYLLAGYRLAEYKSQGHATVASATNRAMGLLRAAQQDGGLVAHVRLLGAIDPRLFAQELSPAALSGDVPSPLNTLITSPTKLEEPS